MVGGDRAREELKKNSGERRQRGRHASDMRARRRSEKARAHASRNARRMRGRGKERERGNGGWRERARETTNEGDTQAIRPIADSHIERLPCALQSHVARAGARRAAPPRRSTVRAGSSCCASTC
eukprot:189864-Pleurochrysis_carterae.AAC.3